MTNRRTTTVTTACALFALVSSANAAIDFGSAPDWFTVSSVIAGTEATPSNTSKWFAIDGTNAVGTKWSGQGITFDTSGLAEDNYMIGVTARNFGPLGLASNYSNFKVDVTVNGSTLASNALIVASDTVWNTVWIDAGMLSGDVSVTLNWRNDSYNAGNYDANIAFGGVQFARSAVPTPGTMALSMVAGAAILRRRR